MNNPYIILNIPKNATPQQVERAYRRLGKIHHPDKGGEAAKFQLIEDAYKSLIENKPMPAAKFRSNATKAPDVQAELKVSITDIYKGAKKRITVNTIMKDMNGRQFPRKKTFELDINSENNYQQKICLRGKGNEFFDCINGDIIIELKQQTDPEIDNFELNGIDLIFKKTLTLSEVITGYCFPIKHPNGKVIAIKGRMNYLNERVIYKDYGLPVMEKPGHFGSLIVKLNFDFNSFRLLNHMDRLKIRKCLDQFPATAYPPYDIPFGVDQPKGTSMKDAESTSKKYEFLPEILKTLSQPNTTTTTTKNNNSTTQTTTTTTNINNANLQDLKKMGIDLSSMGINLPQLLKENGIDIDFGGN